MTLRAKMFWLDYTHTHAHTHESVSKRFPDWPPGARTANGTALCQLGAVASSFVSQSSEFCRHSPLCCFSM